MTPSQAKALEYLKSKFLEKHYGSTAESYEFKKFEVEEKVWHNDYRNRDKQVVFVALEAGLKGDEGTLASALCRTYRYIMIKPKGAAVLLNGKKRKNGWWAVYYEQTKY
jgi:hypothetical protein